MGLFSRKNSSRLQANGNNNHSDGELPPPSANGTKPFAAMKRGNSNPAQNASIPAIPLPKAPDPNLDPAGYLRSIYAVRERSKLVMDKANRNHLRHFNVDMSKFEDDGVLNCMASRGPIYACHLLSYAVSPRKASGGASWRYLLTHHGMAPTWIGTCHNMAHFNYWQAMTDSIVRQYGTTVVQI